MRSAPEIQADFRCGLADGFFAVASLAGFLPAIGISISFWPAAALRGFFADFFSGLGPRAAKHACRTAFKRFNGDLRPDPDESVYRPVKN